MIRNEVLFIVFIFNVKVTREKYLFHFNLFIHFDSSNGSGKEQSIFIVFIFNVKVIREKLFFFKFICNGRVVREKLLFHLIFDGSYKGEVIISFGDFLMRVIWGNFICLFLNGRVVREELLFNFIHIS